MTNKHRTAATAVLTAAASIILPALHAAPPRTKMKTDAPVTSSLVERIGNTAYIRTEASSFETLTPRQKELAYWLSQASIAIDPIIYDQQSRFGLRQKYILDLIAAHPKGQEPRAAKKIADFTKLFWASHGNHNGITAQKFVPTFTPTELEIAALTALRNTPHPALTEARLKNELAELRPSLFDPDYEPQLTAKSPKGGQDILQGSANNFYGRDVTLAEVEKFKEQYPLNSRLARRVDGTLVEEVYRAGTPDGSVKPGLYAEYLGKAIEYLRKARPVAEPGQAPVIDALIKFYQTGEFRDWIDFGVKWVQNNPKVDFANGFIEVYRDPRGAKGTSQSFVSITDEKVNALMQKIGANAEYFEKRAPWADQYKKLGLKPPMAKAIETVVETGDFGVITVGDNLPNENEVREKFGTKSFLFTGSTRALNHARGQAATNEFAYDAEERKIVNEYGDDAEDLLTAMHEIIGHGSGKVSPKLTEDPSTYLKEYYSTLEEARADLMALWNVWDPKLVELGFVTKANQRDVGKAMYYNQFRAPLTQLRSITRGDTIEEDHQRDRQLIALYVLDKVPGSLEWAHRDGKTYIHILDFDKVHQGVGMLLAELMRIKGEGDYPAIKALVDQYGVHFDPKLRDEVVARYTKLNIPVYFAGVNADLTPSIKAGKVTTVTMTYPKTVTEQQLRYAAMYHPELAPARPAT
ncbi:MAG: putative dipeptidyl-peptidase [Acidobacteria bacterium]|nr:putative dipeptidyl-peptidase [Acidobacteriota bacterium]